MGASGRPPVRTYGVRESEGARGRQLVVPPSSVLDRPCGGVRQESVAQERVHGDSSKVDAPLDL